MSILPDIFTKSFVVTTADGLVLHADGICTSPGVAEPTASKRDDAEILRRLRELAGPGPLPELSAAVYARLLEGLMEPRAAERPEGASRSSSSDAGVPPGMG